jgi:hypothetical protein
MQLSGQAGESYSRRWMTALVEGANKVRGHTTSVRILASCQRSFSKAITIPST